jgi:hypothetical protein
MNAATQRAEPLGQYRPYKADRAVENSESSPVWEPPAAEQARWVVIAAPSSPSLSVARIVRAPEAIDFDDYVVPVIADGHTSFVLEAASLPEVEWDD